MNVRHVLLESDASRRLTFLGRTVNWRYLQQSRRKEALPHTSPPPFVGDGSVDHRRRDVAVAEPVLNIRRAPLGVHEMRGDRMAEHVGMPGVWRQSRGFRVPAEELVDRRGGHGPTRALARLEEIWA